GGEDAVQEDLAEEQNPLLWKPDGEIAARVRAAEEHDVDALSAERERLLVGDEDGAGGQLPRVGAADAAIENRLRRRVDDVGHAGGERGVAGGVVARGPGGGEGFCSVSGDPCGGGGRDPSFPRACPA